MKTGKNSSTSIQIVGGSSSLKYCRSNRRHQKIHRRKGSSPNRPPPCSSKFVTKVRRATVGCSCPNKGSSACDFPRQQLNHEDVPGKLPKLRCRFGPCMAPPCESQSGQYSSLFHAPFCGLACDQKTSSPLLTSWLRFVTVISIRYPQPVRLSPISRRSLRLNNKFLAIG